MLGASAGPMPGFCFVLFFLLMQGEDEASSWERTGKALVCWPAGRPLSNGFAALFFLYK